MIQALEKYPTGARVLIETTVTDRETGLAPDPPPTVRVRIYDSRMVEAGNQVMNNDGTSTDGKQALYSVTWAIPDDAREGPYSTRLEYSFADQTKDKELIGTRFHVVPQPPIPA